MSGVNLTSEALITTPSPGAIEYNGQHYMTDSNSARAQVKRITVGTAVATTSGTSVSFTGIPAWAKKITVMFGGVSLSGTDNILVQIGSGSTTITGYISSSTRLAAAGATAYVASTAGFVIGTTATTDVIYGYMQLTLLNSTSNYWVSGHNLANNAVSCTLQGGGAVSISGSLDRIVIGSAAGANTFDAGSINVMWEG